MAKRTLIFFIVITIALFCGCRSVNEEKRISGIVDAVYTSYKTEKNIEKVENYLTKKVSIPSKAEIEQYFKTADERKKTTTDYAKLNGVQANEYGQAYWWTRSRATNPYRLTPGGSFDSAASGYFSSAGILPQIYISK